MSTRKYTPPILKSAYNQVARRVDTNDTKITVADTYRTLSEFFIYLSRLPSEEAFEIVAKGIKNAKKK